MRRVAFVISSLSHGGAERQVSMLARLFAAEDMRTAVFTLSGPETAQFYDPGSAVLVKPLGLLQSSPNLLSSICANMGRVFKLRKELLGWKPDCVLSFGDSVNILTVMALMGTAIPVAVSERIDPSKHKIGRAWDALRKLMYPKARGVVVQTWRIRKEFPRHWNVLIVPNGFSQADVAATSAGRRESEKTVLAVGRLEPQKGFDSLIRAFGGVVAKHGDWRLVIWGEGGDRPRLEELVKELGLEEKVRLPGVTKDISSRYGDANLFVLPSLYEGFPNVLGEAQVYGLPCIAFEDVSGVEELLENGVNGLVVSRSVDRVAGLTNALLLLMGDSEERKRMGLESLRRIERFSLDSVFGLWKGLVAEMIEGRER